MPREVPPPLTFQLARQRGDEFRSVLLSVTASQVRLGTIDAGPAVLRWWGREEYEFWVDVPAKALPALVYALLKEKYEGNLEAVDQFRNFCTDHNIPHRFMTWT
jgi:hypothetical protein